MDDPAIVGGWARLGARGCGGVIPIRPPRRIRSGRTFSALLAEDVEPGRRCRRIGEVPAVGLVSALGLPDRTFRLAFPAGVRLNECALRVIAGGGLAFAQVTAARVGAALTDAASVSAGSLANAEPAPASPSVTTSASVTPTVLIRTAHSTRGSIKLNIIHS